MVFSFPNTLIRLMRADARPESVSAVLSTSRCSGSGVNVDRRTADMPQRHAESLPVTTAMVCELTCGSQQTLSRAQGYSAVSLHVQRAEFSINPQ